MWGGNIHGGVPLASKKRVSATTEGVDVAYLIEAFQSLNSCILSISFELTVRSGRPDLMIIATAYTINPASAERVVLVSWRSSLSQSNCRTLEAATILSLYRLDGLLAQHELAAPPPK